MQNENVAMIDFGESKQHQLMFLCSIKDHILMQLQPLDATRCRRIMNAHRFSVYSTIRTIKGI